METFLGGLALAAVSGVTFLAYRHPRAYSRFRRILLFALTTVIAFVLGNYLGTSSYLVSRLADSLKANPEEKIGDSAFVIRSLAESTDSFQRVAAVCIAALAYVSLLSFLPSLFDEKDKPDTM